jgi:chromosomal replication initiation ATPase DnaA
MGYRRRQRPKRGRKKRSEADIAQAVVAHVYGVPVDEMRACTRCGPRAAFARQVAMYLAHVTYGLSLAEIGFAFGRDRSTASYACHHIEDLRDDPRLDQRLNRLEDMLRDAAHIGAVQ